MSKNLITGFMKSRAKFNDEEYFMSTLAYHLAPVIRCKKASTILTFNRYNRDMYSLWQRYRYEYVANSPISFYELKRTEEGVSVLFFIPCNLLSALKADEHAGFLQSYGYNKAEHIAPYLKRLKERYEDGCPHEIGLFLGVPLKDVKSFINNNGKNYLFCGYWKVYHRMRDNLEIFEDYDKAKLKVIKEVNNGRFYDLLAI